MREQQLQRALLGGVLVRLAFKRVQRLVTIDNFSADNDKAVFRALMAHSLAGKDADDKTYLEAVAMTLRFQARGAMYLAHLIETFCEVADECENWALEDLARSVAARPAPAPGVVIDLHGGAR